METPDSNDLLAASLWVISLAFVQSTLQLFAVSLLSGVSMAFSMLLFSLYGDFFKRKQHAMLVVLWEVFLMTGRILNLIPVKMYLPGFDFSSYFLAVGLLSLAAPVGFIILRLLYSKGTARVDPSQ
jgi:hypothetical protein